MPMEMSLQYNNLNDLRVTENIEEIRKYANLGKVKVNVVDCCYIITKNENNNLQITMSDPHDISDRTIAIKQTLANLLDIRPVVTTAKDPIESNVNNTIIKQLIDTTATNFSVFASEKINSIDKLTTSLASTQQEFQELVNRFQSAKKKGGAYADAIFSDEELLNQYKTKKNDIDKTTTQLEIETQQLKKTAELYADYLINIDEDNTATQQAAYDFACAECHYLEQEVLMAEISELGKKLVSIAQKNNSTIVFPGRSLIACAAYIEKNYPNIKVVKIPISALPKLVTLENSKAVNKIYNYVNNYLVRASASNNLVIVDYIDSGKSLSIVQEIANYNKLNNKTTSVAVYSKYSAVKSNEELQANNNITANSSFNHFLIASNDNYSPLANALQYSTFDEIAPYGKYEIAKIIDGQAEPYRSTDGFNLLKKLQQ